MEQNKTISQRQHNKPQNHTQNSRTQEGSGEYFVRIGIGSPPKFQYMVIDSGSDIVWIQCEPCDQCYNQTDPIFNPAFSASFIGVSCSSSVCNQLDDVVDCRKGRCGYQVAYGDGSYTKGILALETITIGRTIIQDTAIGCGHWNEGMFVGAAGLLGLGGGSMSFVGQLGAQTDGAFGYCLISRGTGSSGSLEFGRQAMPVDAIFSQKLETPKNETQQERVQKFDGDLDKDKVERAKLSLPQAMKDRAHGDKEVVQALQDCCNKAIDPSLDLDH
ncbi:Eukaryotic aspartyl protease family protein [Trifolium repens]|nr:Eukaryotic aspartyl protease family protein [Trifolium repens]KAK2453799.1 Eukaryotic aspartyl protease family protein [Trifolium repens]